MGDPKRMAFHTAMGLVIAGMGATAVAVGMGSTSRTLTLPGCRLAQTVFLAYGSN